MPPEIRFDPFNKESSVPPPHVLSLQYVVKRVKLTRSMVYHTLVILLHRPFVETAASPDTSVVSTCWSRCEDAARNTTALLKRYRAAFSLARAPYLIVCVSA
jgi:hypothetical protein